MAAPSLCVTESQNTSRDEASTASLRNLFQGLTTPIAPNVYSKFTLLFSTLV